MKQGFVASDQTIRFRGEERAENGQVVGIGAGGGVNRGRRDDQATAAKQRKVRFDIRVRHMKFSLQFPTKFFQDEFAQKDVMNQNTRLQHIPANSPARERRQ